MWLRLILLHLTWRVRFQLSSCISVHPEKVTWESAAKPVPSRKSQSHQVGLWFCVQLCIQDPPSPRSCHGEHQRPPNLWVLQMCKTSRCFLSIICHCLVTGGLSELSTCDGSQQFVLNVQQLSASPNFICTPTGTRNACSVVDIYGNVKLTV